MDTACTSAPIIPLGMSGKRSFGQKIVTFAVTCISERIISEYQSGHFCVLCKIINRFIRWVLISSIDKVLDGYIKDLRFNLYLHQKLIGILIW